MFSYSNIQEKIGSSIYEKDKEEMEDFNILKYQILSGNNNRKLLKQIKKIYPQIYQRKQDSRTRKKRYPIVYWKGNGN